MQSSIRLPDDLGGRTVEVLGGHGHENDGERPLAGGMVAVDATKFIIGTSVNV